MTEENKEDFELEWMFAEYGAGRVVSEIAKELGKSEGWDKEGIIYADVNPAAVPQASQNNPWYIGRRPDLRIPFSLWQQMCFKG